MKANQKDTKIGQKLFNGLSKDDLPKDAVKTHSFLAKPKRKSTMIMLAGNFQFSSCPNDKSISSIEVEEH